MKKITSTQIKVPRSTSQRGVGMIEVLVAMMLLAIGVLGYAALQVRAVEATGEALNRSQAMVILRGLAESARVNSTAQSSYTGASGSATPDCYSEECDAAELAAFDVYQAAQTAARLGMTINILACPGAAARQCLFAAWGKTTATIGTTTDTNCMTSAGVYHPKATCIMMEAY